MNFQLGCQEDHQPTLSITDPIGSVRTVLEKFPSNWNSADDKWVFSIKSEHVTKCSDLIPLFESDTVKFTEMLDEFLSKL